MRRRRYPRQLIRLAKESNIHFAAVSTAIRARAIKLGIPSEKITVSHIGVDTKIFQPGPIPIPDRSKRVLFVGRLVEKKGAAYLIRAFAKLDKAHPGAELIIVGDGILRDELQRLAVELNVRVQFLGSQSTHEVWRQMQFAQVLCAPSVTALNGDAEGLPIVILEALACGLPVFTSAAGAEFLKNGDAGINHAEGDINALADLLSRILKHDPLIIRQTKEARRVATEKFDIAVCIEHLEHIYSELEKKRT
jgi:glycosyltransferase involved in cell wall biosynthesis